MAYLEVYQVPVAYPEPAVSQVLEVYQAQVACPGPEAFQMEACRERASQMELELCPEPRLCPEPALCREPQ